MIIRKYYLIGGSKLCQENGLTHKSASSIKSRAFKLGTRTKVENWTPDEDALLYKYYAIGGPVLCQEMGLKSRSVGSIKNRASRLNLKIVKGEKV